MVAAAAIGLVSTGAGAAPAPRVALPSPVEHVAAVYGRGVQVDSGPAPARITVSFRVYLADRAPRAEAAFAHGVSDPGNSRYGRYLTVAGFNRRFGPRPAEARAVRRWAVAEGLTVTQTTARYVAIKGSAPAVGRALHTSIHLFEPRSGGRGLYTPVRGMSVPAALRADVATVVGLDDVLPASTAHAARATRATRAAGVTADTTPAAFRCSSWWGEYSTAIPTLDGQTSAPDAVCGYTTQQLRSAYGVSTDSGRGTTIAVVLGGALGTVPSDARRFFASEGISGFAAGQLVNDSAQARRTCGAQGATPEGQLDVELAHTIAPAARVRFVGVACESGGFAETFLDAYARIVDHHLADVVTDSETSTESGYTAATAAAFTQVFEQGAIEGIGFDFDAGDGANDASGGRTAPAVQFPGSDPWATAVGGVATEIGHDGSIVDQLGWGDLGRQENAAGSAYLSRRSLPEGSTGGRSTLFKEPAYQRGVVPASLATAGHTRPAGREVPDISADADQSTGILIGLGGRHYHPFVSGGTSASSPIVAALEADAMSVSGRPVGFANPLLYRLRHSPGIDDVTASPTPALVLGKECPYALLVPGQPCVIQIGPDTTLTEAPGYDDVTGVGAANGQFITALAGGAR